MKALFSGKTKFSQGVSTLEILIAAAILTLSLTAIITVIFGNQSLATDTQTNDEAIAKAQALLEDKRAISRNDFSQVYSYPSPVSDGIYNKDLQVLDLTQCKKQATSTVTWIEGGRTLSVDFSTYLTDITGFLALGGDCDVNPPSSDWRKPNSFNSIDFTPSGISATGIDVEHSIVFMTGRASAVGKPDFFIFDASATTLTTPPVLVYSLDTGDGLASIDAVANSDGNFYAFVGNGDTSISPLEELLVISEAKDLSSSPTVVAQSTLPNMTAGLCPGAQCPIIRSIYYYGGKVYVGTQYLANLSAPATKNNEFHIYDVSDPTAPSWQGSYNVNHNVNSIRVRGKYAYLAVSGSSGQLVILDISDPSNITPVSTLTIGSSQDAETLDLLGNYVYFGKDRNASGPDFFVINVSDPTHPSLVGSADVPLKSGTLVSGVRSVWPFAFVGTTDSTQPFIVFNISNPASPIRWDTTPFNFSEKMVGLDYENDKIYTANQSNDALRIIYSSP